MISIVKLNFPQPLARLITKLPSTPPSFVFTQVLSLMLHEVIIRGDLKAMCGKHVAIYVIDTGVKLHFTVHLDGFTHIVSKGLPDLSISATLHDFYLLAMRKEDPDTLFFKRRLVIEGDTELGLVAKNTLDGMDFHAATLLAPKNLWSLCRLSVKRFFKY